MSKSFLGFFSLLWLLNCSNRTSTPITGEFEIQDYIIDSSFAATDVRRYGVFPDSIIAHHPYLKIDKLKALQIIASHGYKLNFPKGVYNRSFIIDSVSDVEFNFNESIFTGSVKILNSRDVVLKGSLRSELEFYTRSSNGITVDTLVIGSVNSDNTLGLQIHAKSRNIRIIKAVVNGLTTNPDNYNNKAALIIHGHNAEPSNITINDIVIKSSGRIGAFISGEDILIEEMKIENYALSTSEGMNPMEGLLQEESGKLSGLWVRNCWNCELLNVSIITPKLNNATYSVNLGVGDETIPTVIRKLNLSGKPLPINRSPRTNVEIIQITRY